MTKKGLDKLQGAMNFARDNVFIPRVMKLIDKIGHRVDAWKCISYKPSSKYKALVKTQTITSNNGGVLTENHIKKTYDKRLAKWVIDVVFRGKGKL